MGGEDGGCGVCVCVGEKGEGVVELGGGVGG